MIYVLKISMKASNLEVDVVAEYKKYHRTRRLPRCLDERQNTTAEIELPQFYRKEFAHVLDTLLLQIREKNKNIKFAFKPLLHGLCPIYVQYWQSDSDGQIYFPMVQMDPSDKCIFSMENK